MQQGVVVEMAEEVQSFLRLKNPGTKGGRKGRRVYTENQLKKKKVL